METPGFFVVPRVNSQMIVSNIESAVFFLAIYGCLSHDASGLMKCEGSVGEQSNEAGASETIQQLLLTTFSGDQRLATKEDVARLYSVIVHLRDIVVTQAGIIATMPLTPEQASHFSENEMPLKRLQQAIGDGLVELLGDKPEEIDD